MKKITLALMLFISVLAFAQLPQEGFEGSWPPTGWGIYDNGIGTNFSWTQSNNTAAQPSHTGTYAAYINRENVPTGMPQDWLVTPQFPVPANAQIRFWSRLTQGGNQGSIYQVRLSTDPVQSNLSPYIVLQEWTEDEINPSQLEYIEKKINIPEDVAAQGTPVYIAFVMMGDQADRWLIDDVQVSTRCLEPENLTANNITLTSAELSWDNPSGAASWEIEVVTASGGTTGSGIVVTDNPYTIQNLDPGQDYRYYVRAICSSDNMSEWVGPYFFGTVTPGSTCNAPLQVTNLPYQHTGNTADYGDDYTGTPGTSCGTGEWDWFLDGYEVVYSYTPTADMVAHAWVSELSESYAGLFVYTSCDDIGTQCYAGDIINGEVENPDLGMINLTAGTTYYFVISSPSFPNTIGYTFHLERVPCAYPVALVASDVTTNSATIGWVEFGTATSWEYVFQPEGTGAPTGAGTHTGSTSVDITSLSPNTLYEFYVRADCGTGEFSPWSGPYVFSTLCPPFDVPFTEGFNSDSATEDCWKVRNLEGPGTTWNLDDTTFPYEGDESASLDPMFSTDNHDWLISPGINLTANQRLRFRHKINGFWGSNNFKVVLSTTGIDPEDFTTVLLPSASYEVGDYVEHEIFLNTIPSGLVYFAWVMEAGGDTALLIDDVRIDPIPPCPVPTALTAGNFTTTTADLSWTPGFTETAWEVVVQAPGTGEPTADGTPATNPYTAENLLPNTEYEYYVRAICGGTNGNSPWAGPFLFRTECAAFDVPFVEGFNSDSPTEACWKINDVNGGWDKWVLDNDFDNIYEGDQSARYNSEFTVDNDDWLISPAINVTGGERLSFQYRVYDNIYPVNMEVRLSTGGTDPADFTTVLVPVQSYTNEYYVKKVVDLTAYTGTVRIAFHAPGGSDSGMYWYLDDVRVEAIPACADPYDLVVSNLTQTSAQLAWTPGNSETQWEVVVQPSGTGTPTTAGTITSDNPYVANGLTPGTTYEFYIRAVCGSTQSIWAGPVPFTTLISNDECADAINVPVNPGTECVQSVGGTVIGATMSSEAYTCDTAPVNDVWFQFTATSTTHNISLLNINGGWSLPFQLYGGADCSSLTPLYCNNYDQSVNIDGLVPGQVYRLRVYTGQATDETTFEVCIRTPFPPITTDNTTYTVEQLITDVLIGSQCAQVSNVTYSTGASFTDNGGMPGPNGIAYFSQNGSQFPMAGGVILSTGNAMEAAGPEASQASSGDTSWPGDDDLDAVILEGTGDVMNSTNATIIEFDFVPLIDNMSFDFLFASEEYGTFQCAYSDSFAFLLTDSNGVTTNLAVLPDGETPVSVITIRDDEYNSSCESVNPEYFAEFNQGVDAPLAAINYLGRTVKLTASASVVPNTSYHIKMVIADRGGEFDDTILDSAVFLAQGSFNIGSATIGADLTIADGTAVCSNASHLIQSGMSPTLFTFKWYKDGIELIGQTGPDLLVTQTGNYLLEASVMGANCTATDSILVEFFPPVETLTQQPQDISQCISGGTASFDLTINNAVIAGTTNPADLTITYHLTQADAENGVNPVSSPYASVAAAQTLYARVVYNPTGCYGVRSFQVKALPVPVFNIGSGYTRCEGQPVVIAVDASNFNEGDATYQWMVNGVVSPETGSSITVNENGIVGVVVTLNSCTAVASTEVTPNTTAVNVVIEGDCENGAYYMTAVPVAASFDPDEVTYTWTGPVAITDDAQKVRATSQGTYTVTVTLPDGCSGTAMFTPASVACLIQKGISPNGDGDNENFNLSDFNVLKLSIFNRYGREVFSMANYTDQLHGQESNGNDLPTGTYFYSIEMRDQAAVTGWIYINREE
jgi:gliding motility-associated-like protein